MERHAKVKIGFLVLFIAVLGTAAVLVAGQAGNHYPEWDFRLSSGYAIQ